MVFPLIHIGDTVLRKAYVAIDAVGYNLRDNVNVGDAVSLYSSSICCGNSDYRFSFGSHGLHVLDAE